MNHWFLNKPERLRDALSFIHALSNEITMLVEKRKLETYQDLIGLPLIGYCGLNHHDVLYKIIL